MSPWVLQLFWISLPFTVVIISLLLPLEVQAQQNLSSDSDVDVGWIAAGVHDPGGLPTCGYCVNLFGGDTFSVNSSVVMYQCCGTNYNELWAYQNSTNSIVVSNVLFNFTQGLCLDAPLWRNNDSLVLSLCNSSVVTQQWTCEGNRVRSGLTDSGGYLYLWSPDFGKNSSNAGPVSPLRIASSKPYDDIVTSYTSDFTFLSTKNFVDRSTDRLSTEGLLLISNSPTGQITNGGFENSTYESGASIQTTCTGNAYINYFTLCGWVIDYGPIAYVNTGILPPANGSYSIHLNSYYLGGDPGTISQTFRTETGTDYSLSFYFRGFPPNLTVPDTPVCSADYTEAFLQVLVTNATTTDKLSGPLKDGTGLIQEFTSSVAQLNAQNIAASWIQETVVFTASTNVTKISFRSLNDNSPCEPMIDTVEVSPTKLPPRRNNVSLEVGASIGGLASLITILGIIYGISYFTRVREDYSGLYTTENARVYSIKELSVATKKFSSVLGEGGFGTVYKADFPDGTVGAVKVEKRKGPNSSSKVLASDEVAVLLRVHHRNLVNLTGFCIDKGLHLLLFEHLPNGTLYDRLHQSILPSPRATSMDAIELQQLRSNVILWKQRVRIAADAACGLEYLHHEADPPIVHRDIKSQNILLTTTDSAKLADFGLSKIAPVNATSFQSIETMVKGSIGYLDPQYLTTGVFSPKSDVYSFGVVLLELISGHPVIYNATSLASWAAPYMTSPSLYYELVDNKLKSEFNAEELESLVDLSRMCMQADGKIRPNMRQVVALLNSRLVTRTGNGSHKYSSSPNSSDES